MVSESLKDDPSLRRALESALVAIEPAAVQLAELAADLTFGEVQTEGVTIGPARTVQVHLPEGIYEGSYVRRFIREGRPRWMSRYRVQIDLTLDAPIPVPLDASTTGHTSGVVADGPLGAALEWFVGSVLRSRAEHPGWACPAPAPFAAPEA